MAGKEFTVTHVKAREPLTIHGATLEDALEKEGLNPDTWKLVEPVKDPEPSDHGKTD